MIQIELRNEILKSSQLEHTLKELEKIFDADDMMEENDKQILDEIRHLSQKYINQYLESQKQVDFLKVHIEALQSQNYKSAQSN